jgi:ABC-type transport system involved in cytochrome bd biosynthesis fused ATPase/permease subunit
VSRLARISSSLREWNALVRQASIPRAKMLVPIFGLIVLELSALYLTYRLVGGLLSATSGARVDVVVVVVAGGLLVAKSVLTFFISSYLYRVYGQLEWNLRRRLAHAAEIAPSSALRSRSVETISHEINVYPHNLAYGVIQQAARLMTDGLLACSVLVVLLISTPMLTICVGMMLGLIGAVIGGQMLRMSRRYGRHCDEGTVALVNHMGRYFAGRNEIEAGPANAWFQREADAINLRLVGARARFNFITLVPRLAFDSAVGVALVVVVIVSTSGIGSLKQSDLALGLAGALKLAPYLSSIVAILMQLGFSRAIIDGFRKAEDWNSSHFLLNGLDAGIRRSGTSVDGWIAVGANRIEVEGGDVVVLRGRSGSGKTTLAEYFCDVIRGRVSGSNHEGSATPVTAEQELRLAYCSQFPTVMPTTLAENLAAEGVEGAIPAWIDRYGLGHLAEAASLNQASLSGGERQRIGLIRTFSRSLDIAILDEPTASVGELYRGLVVDDISALARQGVLVVVVTHDPVFETIASKMMDLG